ncbi:hypothetical protein BGZ50_006380 [Haplosporangium sp. Z 11]|nr:hypothetical protein BGZ50_006380 [Haplosporangium sp. Z 11]
MSSIQQNHTTQAKEYHQQQMDATTGALTFAMPTSTAFQPSLSTVAPSSLMLVPHVIPSAPNTEMNTPAPKKRGRKPKNRDTSESFNKSAIAMGKKRGRKPKVVHTDIECLKEDSALNDATAVDNIPNRPHAGPAKVTPVATECLSTFQTTGAFLTRTASKLLGGEAVTGFDSNIHGYAYGRAVKVLNIDKNWYFGAMVGLENGKIKVHFDGWSTEFDEWLASDSRRLKTLDAEEARQREALLQSMQDAGQLTETSSIVSNTTATPVLPHGSSTQSSRKIRQVPKKSTGEQKKPAITKQKISHCVHTDVVKAALVTSVNTLEPARTEEQTIKCAKIPTKVARLKMPREQATDIPVQEPMQPQLKDLVPGTASNDNTKKQTKRKDVVAGTMAKQVPEQSPLSLGAVQIVDESLLQEAPTSSSNASDAPGGELSDDITFSSDELSDPCSTTPSLSDDQGGRSEAQDDPPATPFYYSLGNPIQLNLAPLEILKYEYEDEESEILKIIHRVLDTGLIKNRVVEHSPEYYLDFADSTRKKKKKKRKEVTEGAGDGGENKEGGEGETDDDDDDDDDAPKRSSTKTKDRFVAQLEARQEGKGIPVLSSIAAHKPIVRKDTEELRQVRQMAMRNMCSAPLIQFVRQVIYNEADRTAALNNTFERRKQKLAKALSRGAVTKRRFGPLSKRILGLSNLSNLTGITFNEAGHIETTTSLKIKSAMDNYRKAKKKKAEHRILKAMSTSLQKDNQMGNGSIGPFQSLRSLTSTKKRKRIMAEDHIAFLKCTLVPGTRIRARDRQMDWLTAVIRDVKNSRVLVHYEGYHQRFNEWIDINSERLQYDPSLEQIELPQSNEAPAAVGSVAEKDVVNDDSIAPKGDNVYPSDDASIGADTAVALADNLSSEGGTVEVHCVQCQVKISQFRIYCTYCEVEAKSQKPGHEPFNLCLWCFSNAFPAHHDHPRSSFATKVIVGPRGVRPVKGGIITRFEKDVLDMDYKGFQRLGQARRSATQQQATMTQESDQGFMFMDQWKDRKVCAFCNDDGTTKDHFIGPYPFLLASTNRYGDTKKKHFWAHDACARHSPEVIQATDGSWYNVSLELMHQEQLEKEAAQALEVDESVSVKKKKPVSYKVKARGLSRLVCSYCWSATSAKWRKGYNGVLMCEDCFLAGPINDTPMQPPVGIEGLTGTPEPGADSMITSSTSDRGVGRYATSAEDYSHSPYLTRTAVSAVRFDHSSSQALYLDSYGPAENQLYSLTIDSTYYDIPGRAPRWATHSGTDYHGTWLPQTVRRALAKYTNPNDRILSNFLGRGTDAIECFLMGRCCTAVDINPAAITLSIRNCSFAVPPDGAIKAEHRPTILQGDSRRLTGPLFENESFDHVLSHPPYKDCVAYSTHIDGDLSRFGNAKEFQREMNSVIQETYRLLKMGRRCTLGIGDNREHCFYIPVSFQLIRQYINEGFVLEELIVKRQRYCAMFGLGTYLCVQFDFLCFTHEFVATLRKVPKEEIDTMILEPDYTLLDDVNITSTLRSIPSCPIERKSVVMGSVWTFKPTEEYDFPTLCVSRMVERFGRNDANWEEFKLEFITDAPEKCGVEEWTEDAVEFLAPEEEDLPSYERSRLQQIQENNRMLLALGLITDLGESSDDIGHQIKISKDSPCYPAPAPTALRMIAHIPCSVLKSYQVPAYRIAIMHLAVEALQKLPVTGVFIVGTQDLRTETGKLIPLAMLVLEDVIRVVGEDCLRLKELVEAVPDGYQKDRRKVTCLSEFKEEISTPNDEIPTRHLPIVHACYLVFTKVKEKEIVNHE